MRDCHYAYLTLIIIFMNIGATACMLLTGYNANTAWHSIHSKYPSPASSLKKKNTNQRLSQLLQSWFICQPPRKKLYMYCAACQLPTRGEVELKLVVSLLLVVTNAWQWEASVLHLPPYQAEGLHSNDRCIWRYSPQKKIEWEPEQRCLVKPRQLLWNIHSWKILGEASCTQELWHLLGHDMAEPSETNLKQILNIKKNKVDLWWCSLKFYCKKIHDSWINLSCVERKGVQSHHVPICNTVL